MAARTFPSVGLSPIDAYDAVATRPMVHIETTTTTDHISSVNVKATLTSGQNNLAVAGYYETHLTGTSEGHTYGFGSWINFDGAPTTGAYHIAAQSNGIYGTATMTDTRIIFGLKMEGIVTGTPGVFAPFYIGTSNRVITAVFAMASGASMGISNGTASDTTDGTIPIVCNDDGSSVRYIYLYPNPA